MSEQLNRIEQFLISFAEQTNQRFDHLDNRLNTMQTQLDRIEAAQNDDVVSILKHIDGKITDVKHSVSGLKYDVEYTVKEQSMIKLEIDRVKSR